MPRTLWQDKFDRIFVCTAYAHNSIGGAVVTSKVLLFIRLPIGFALFSRRIFFGSAVRVRRFHRCTRRKRFARHNRNNDRVGFQFQHADRTHHTAEMSESVFARKHDLVDKCRAIQSVGTPSSIPPRACLTRERVRRSYRVLDENRRVIRRTRQTHDVVVKHHQLYPNYM